MKRKVLVGITGVIVGLAVLLNGCGMREMVNIVHCHYSFQKVSSIQWAGIDFMKVGSEFEKLDFSTVADCIAALARKDFALRIVADVKANNPGKRNTSFTGFDYILYYDGIEIASGESVNETDIVVAGGGGSAIIPVGIKMELGNVVSIKQPKESVKNVIGIIREASRLGREDTRFSVKIRPHVRMGNRVVNGHYFNLKKI